MPALKTIALVAAAGAFAAPLAAQDYSWKPDRPINIIVPWSAGGSTDQVTRVVAPILEEALGTEVVVVNQPGASGSTGTKAALDAPRDGYTWTANAIANNATYAVTGLIEDTSIEDYHIYLHVANVPVVSVNADAPYQDFPALLERLLKALGVGGGSGLRGGDVLDFVLVDRERGAYPEGLSAAALANAGIDLIDVPLISKRSAPYYDNELLVQALLSLT